MELFWSKDAATIYAALIAAFLGSWIGAIVALSRFKKERAFDKQLAWYERTIRAMYHLAERIEIASTFQSDKAARPAVRKEKWCEVQDAHVDLDAAVNEARLFGSNEAARNCARICKSVQEVADETEAFDLPNHRRIVAKLPLIDDLAGKLQAAAKPLSEEARRHLGIK
jgi:hypothetical protein